jgi:hypothetical protein
VEDGDDASCRQQSYFVVELTELKATRMSSFPSGIARYRAKGHGGMALWLSPAVWAIDCYRLGNWFNVAVTSVPHNLYMLY